MLRRKKQLELLWRHRRREQIPLTVIAAGRAQQIALRLGLHAFGNHLQVELVRHHDDGLRERHVAGSGGQVAHERLIDLQVVDVEFFQVREG